VIQLVRLNKVLLDVQGRMGGMRKKREERSEGERKEGKRRVDSKKRTNKREASVNHGVQFLSFFLRDPILLSWSKFYFPFTFLY